MSDGHAFASDSPERRLALAELAADAALFGEHAGGAALAPSSTDGGDRHPDNDRARDSDRQYEHELEREIESFERIIAMLACDLVQEEPAPAPLRTRLATLAANEAAAGAHARRDADVRARIDAHAARHHELEVREAEVREAEVREVEVREVEVREVEVREVEVREVEVREVEAREAAARGRSAADNADASSSADNARGTSNTNRTREPDATRRLADAPAVAARIGRTRSTRDWLVAAACVAFGASGTWLLTRTANRAPEPAATDRAAFVRTHPGAVHWPWTSAGDAATPGPVSGEACFDPATGEGLLVIEGLAPNDPARSQYQLWIFDRTRDERYPVDGGVFDVGTTGRTAIPIRSRLSVREPYLFAVTIERPGGVVVSERRIAILAKP